MICVPLLLNMMNLVAVRDYKSLIELTQPKVYVCRTKVSVLGEYILAECNLPHFLMPFFLSRELGMLNENIAI